MGATGVATMPRLVSSLNLTGHAKLIATPPRRWSAQSIMTNSPPPPPTSLPPNGPLGEFPAQQSLKGVGPNADGRCRAGWLLEASGPWVSRDPPREIRGGTQTRTLRGWFLAPSPFPPHDDGPLLPTTFSIRALSSSQIPTSQHRCPEAFSKGYSGPHPHCLQTVVARAVIADGGSPPPLPRFTFGCTGVDVGPPHVG